MNSWTKDAEYHHFHSIRHLQLTSNLVQCSIIGLPITKNKYKCHRYKFKYQRYRYKYMDLQYNYMPIFHHLKSIFNA